MKAIKENIKHLIADFSKKNNCEELRDKIWELINSDEVSDYLLVKQHKKNFLWKLKGELSTINTDRANGGLSELKINQLECDLIQDEFSYLQQTSSLWQKNMKKAILKVKGKC